MRYTNPRLPYFTYYFIYPASQLIGAKICLYNQSLRQTFKQATNPQSPDARRKSELWLAWPRPRAFTANTRNMYWDCGLNDNKLTDAVVSGADTSATVSHLPPWHSRYITPSYLLTAQLTDKIKAKDKNTIK